MSDPPDGRRRSLRASVRGSRRAASATRVVRERPTHIGSVALVSAVWSRVIGTAPGMLARRSSAWIPSTSKVGSRWVVGVRGLEAPALVDRRVHQYRVALHQPELVPADDKGRAGAVDEHGPDHQVHPRQHLLDRQGRREDGGRPASEGDCRGRAGRSMDTSIDEYVGFHADGDEGSMHPDGGPPPITITVAAADPRDATEQNPAPAERLLPGRTPRLASRSSPPPRSSAASSGKPALGVLHGLRRQRQIAPLSWSPRVSSGAGARWKKGEERLFGPKHSPPPTLRLLHLEHHLGTDRPRQAASATILGALRGVGLVRGLKLPSPGAGLDQAPQWRAR